jgi:hypothetical protein
MFPVCRLKARGIIGPTTASRTSGLRETVSAHGFAIQAYDHWQYSNLGMAMLRRCGEQGQRPDGAIMSIRPSSRWGDDRSTTDIPFDSVRQGVRWLLHPVCLKGNRPLNHGFRAFAPAAQVVSVNDM